VVVERRKGFALYYPLKSLVVVVIGQVEEGSGLLKVPLEEGGKGWDLWICFQLCWGMVGSCLLWVPVEEGKGWDLWICFQLCWREMGSCLLWVPVEEGKDWDPWICFQLYWGMKTGQVETDQVEVEKVLACCCYLWWQEALVLGEGTHWACYPLMTECPKVAWAGGSP